MRALTFLCAALVLATGCSRTGDADRDAGSRADPPADTAPTPVPTPNAGTDAERTPDSGTGAEISTDTPAQQGTQDNRSDTGEAGSSTPR
jgi:hypothetical protein